MLPVAFAVALCLGVAHPAVAYQPRYSFANSTSNGTETQVGPKVHLTTVTKIVTQTSGPGCPANYVVHPKPTPTPSPTVTFVNTAPSATLSPNVHWSYDTKSVENVIPLEPKKGSELYYGVSDPSKSGHYAFLTYYFKFPSVNIDHTDHVTVKYHADKGMTASFHNEEAFKHALDSWTTQHGLILIAYTGGCGDYSKGERCYFNVTDIEYKHDERVIIAKGGSKHPDQVINSGETEWGWWDAHKDGASASASGATSGDAFSWGSSTTSTSSPTPTASSSGSDKPAGQLDCTAPVDSVHGFPTACLGSSFDQILDQTLGYTELSPESERFLDSIVSGTNITGQRNSTLSSRAQRMRRRSLAQRGFFSKIGDWFKKAAKTVYNAIASAISIGGSIEKDISFKIPDPDSSNVWAKTLLGGLTQTQSPWGDAILLKSLGGPNAAGSDVVVKYMNIYCVGCGASGRARVAGRARWSPLAGLQEGRLELQTDMQFVLKLGIDAQISLRHDFYTDLFNYGLPALSYGVITIGPYVSVGARVGLEAAARGKVLVGAEMGVQDSLVVLDIVDPSQNRKTGWQPYFKPVFEATGEVALSAELGLPVGLKCGLKISTWEKAVGIVDEPSVKGVAQVAGSIGLTKSGEFTAGFSDNDGCAGILTKISWRNRLWVGLIGPSDTPVLDTNDRTLLRKCIGKDTKPARRDTIDAVRSMRVARNVPEGHAMEAPAQLGTRSSSLTYKMQTVPTELYNNTLNHKLSQLVNPTGSTRVVSCANGNLYAVRNDNNDSEYCFGLWDTTNESEVVYDGVHRSLHYYGDTMAKLGVSRLRASGSGEVPRTSVTVALLPHRDQGGDAFYIAVDQAEQVFYPVVCDFADQGLSKVFVVNDPDKGIETLQRKDVMYSITGGEVAKCQLLALKP